MAASGIAEHSEARRRQHVVNKKASKMKLTMDKMKDNIDFEGYPIDPHPTMYEGPPSPSSHMRKVGSPPGFHNHEPPIIDKLRRQQARQQQMEEYTAKLPNRLSSKDYTQQW